MTVSINDVEDYDSTGWSQLDESVKTAQLEQAKSLIDHQFGDRVSTLPEFVGDRDNGIKLLAAHLFEIAEGGEAQSESGEGGNVTYNTISGDTMQSLTETRYGRMFRDLHLRDEQGIGVVRSK
jgi:hypothetical protein